MSVKERRKREERENEREMEKEEWTCWCGSCMIKPEYASEQRGDEYFERNSLKKREISQKKKEGNGKRKRKRMGNNRSKTPEREM